MRKIVAAAALLFALTGCTATAEASAPAKESPAELVAFTQSEAFSLCTTLPEDMIPDCITAARDW